MTHWTYKSEDEANFIHEIESLSDRLVGLLAPIVIDSRITEAIQSRLKDGPIKGGSTILTDLFAPHGELGSFGTRILVAYAMEIFTAETFLDLNRIEKVRNEFAHLLKTRSFSDQPVVDLVRNIKINERYPHDEKIHIVMGSHQKGFKHSLGSTKYDDTIPREKFLRAIQIISHELYMFMSLNPGVKNPI